MIWVLAIVSIVIIAWTASVVVNWITDCLYQRFFEKDYGEYDLDVDQGVWEEVEK